MADPIFNDQNAFRPNLGGFGVRFNVSANVATALAGIPGTGEASQGAVIVRIRVKCGDTGAACIAFNGVATANHMELAAGAVEMFTLPFSPNGVTMSAFGLSAATTVQATAGQGF